MSDDTDRPADMPPWIVDDWDVNPHFGVTIWSDGTMGLGRKWSTVPAITRDEAIAMCRRILAILEGDQPTPIT